VSPEISKSELLERYERRLRLMVPAELELLKPLALFAGIPEKARDKVIEKVRKYLHVVTYNPGDLVLRQGEYGDSAFYIVNGAAEVVLKPEDAEGPRKPQVRGGAHVPGAAQRRARPGAERLVGRGGTSGTVILSAFPAEIAPGGRTILEKGELFGEMSALSRYPISASVRAETPLRLLQIRLPGLRMLSASSKEFKAFLDSRYRERTLARHLKSVGLFAKVDDRFIETVRKKAELQSFGPGQIIAEEGTPADAFYLVRGGYVKVSVAAGTSDLAVTYLRTGDFAGEAALLLDESWPFTLQALEHVELVKLTKAEFKEITAAHPEVEEELWTDLVERLKLRGQVSRHPVSSEYLQMAMETGLIHGESVFLIDLSTCTRCDECVRGCADAHGGQPKFIREGQRYRNWLIPTACYQCTDPVCMMDCPTGAITRGVGTLEVTINEPTCIGCGNCATRCPWGNITMRETEEKRPDGKPVELASKCDLCLGRPEGPACVQMCPHGSALRVSFKDMERVTSTLK
jgi:CRP-like cAMP-binding protein/Fe-S-cluster-containing hydrogenase component 2